VIVCSDQYSDMPSRSPRATSTRREASPLQAVHPGYYSLHGGTASTARVPSTSTYSGTRPTYPADVAQSRLFTALLLDELDELEDLVAAAERRCRRRREESPDDPVAMSHTVVQLRERISDVRRLLDALHERFPRD
jgi:hypothetical protein